MAKLKSRVILVIVLILATLFDLGTFLYFSDFHAFEVNPLFVLTKSVLSVVFFKLGIIAFLVYLLTKKRTGRTLQYALVLSAVYLILLQLLGGYSNLSVAKESPPVESAYEPAEAVQVYVSLGVILYIVPMILGTFSFWLYHKLGYDDD